MGANFDFIQKEKDSVAEEDGNSEISDVVGTASILVVWDDCLIAEYVNSINKSVFEYTVEISPETEIPVKSFEYYKDTGLLLEVSDTRVLSLLPNGGPNIIKDGAFK